MTILGLIGSQRKLGNCELFVKEISRNIPYPHDLKLIRLPSLDIKACNGCYRCLGEGTCPVDDETSFLFDEIATSDGLIIAAPVYFLGAHACIKRILDRAFSFYGRSEAMAGKPCLLVNVFGMKERIGTAPQTLLTFASFLGFRVKASVDLLAALPGDVISKPNYLRKARRLAGLLVGDRSAPRASRSCPFCGNRIVRMRRRGFTCTLCHGSFHLAENGRPIKERPGWDIADIQFVKEHREWLKGMKERFLSRKREIVSRTLPYKDIGRWIEPKR
jgi:NAD(P)H-dependent FMN reductase